VEVKIVILFYSSDIFHFTNLLISFWQRILTHNKCRILLNPVGEFGDVYKGKLILQDGRTILIAAKTLKVFQRIQHLAQ
jgi:hypothetical protein